MPKKIDTDKTSSKNKSSTEKAADKAGVKEEVKSAKDSGIKKPTNFVKLLRGTQFTDRDSGDIYILDKLTPVKEITTWVRIQEKFGLFEIVE